MIGLGSLVVILLGTYAGCEGTIREVYTDLAGKPERFLIELTCRSEPKQETKWFDVKNSAIIQRRFQ